MCPLDIACRLCCAGGAGVRGIVMECLTELAKVPEGLRALQKADAAAVVTRVSRCSLWTAVCVLSSHGAALTTHVCKLYQVDVL